jgi:hypothetical protein
VYNDAGPIAVNLGTPPTATTPPDTPWLSVSARQNDWQFQKFYPQSCIEDGLCNATIREAFYETDSDRTNRFFAQGDGTRMDPEAYRALILAEHGALNEAYPRRYKRFIVSADDTHGAVQVTAPTPNFPFPQEFSFYTQEANGTSLIYWATTSLRTMSLFQSRNIVSTTRSQTPLHRCKGPFPGPFCIWQPGAPFRVRITQSRSDTFNH